MALSPENEALFNFLASKKETRNELLKKAIDAGYKDHSAIRAQEEIEFAQAPIREELETLKKKLHEREQADTWGQQRNSVRGGKFKFNEEKIAALEERMRSPDSPSFPQLDSHGRTAYQQAAEYFAQLDSPIGASTVPMLDMGGFPVAGQGDAEPWRADMLSDDPAVNPLKMSKKKRKLKARANWKAASNEYMEQLGARQGTRF